MTPPPTDFKVAGIPARLERNVRGTSVFVGTTEHRMGVSEERRNARLALLAASKVPSLPDRMKYESYESYAVAFNAYQRDVLDPLREQLRTLILAEELAFVADLKDVYRS